jgi:hypothetical protein
MVLMVGEMDIKEATMAAAVVVLEPIDQTEQNLVEQVVTVSSVFGIT